MFRVLLFPSFISNLNSDNIFSGVIVLYSSLFGRMFLLGDGLWDRCNGDLLRSSSRCCHPGGSPARSLVLVCAGRAVSGNMVRLTRECRRLENERSGLKPRMVRVVACSGLRSCSSGPAWGSSQPAKGQYHKFDTPSQPQTEPTAARNAVSPTWKH